MTDSSAIETLIFGAIRTLGRIPRSLARQLGNLAGRLIYYADARHRRIVIRNMRHAWGDRKSPDQIQHMARAVFENLGQILFEVGQLLHMGPKSFSQFVRIQGLENYRSAKAQGKGVLCLTAHVGNLELMPIAAWIVSQPLNVVYRPLDFKPLDRVMRNLRGRLGATMIPTKGSMFSLLRSLKRGESVALLMDQNVDWYDGIFVDFFGRRACTNKGLAMLAQRTGAPVLPVFLVRRKGGYTVFVGEEIPRENSGDPVKDMEENTRRYNLAIESIAEQYPEQWFWVHQRWKTRPYCLWPPRSV